MPMRTRSRLAAAGCVLLLAGCTRMPAPGDVAPPATSGPLPVFSKPTEITNPYFPVASIAQTIAFGTDGGSSVREEVTLLPGTKDIVWAGGTTPVRVTQFAGYSDGELVEVAYDYFAQADNGDVYYMGEDVANYSQGQVTDHSGSWLAGKDGALPGLIMPANPVAGMVFHPENAPGIAYETDEVVSLNAQAVTPAGPIDNGLFIKETMMDGGLEHKVWARGYGIVEDQSGEEVLHLVLASRTDATAPAPAWPAADDRSPSRRHYRYRRGWRLGRCTGGCRRRRRSMEAVPRTSRRRRGSPDHSGRVRRGTQPPAGEVVRQGRAGYAAGRQ